MRLVFFLFAIFLSDTTWATKIEEKPLFEMVHEASDIALVTVEKFAGRTKDGSLVTKGKLRSGPGMGNTFVVTLKIVEVLKGKSLRKEMTQVVELWPGWHMEANLSEPVDKKSTLIVFLRQSELGLFPLFAPSPYLGGTDVEREVRTLLKAK